MCGFVGIISKNNKRFSRDTLEAMTSIIAHRGPDDSGLFFYKDWLAMGFRRLSILDLSESGHQPMLSSDRRYVIVYNGEIYNYREIREELNSKGHSFRSGTDTEVILAAYKEYGEQCLNKFTGMFSFIIADLVERKTFIARDHLGIKPLFFYEDNDYYFFFSEVKSLLPYTALSPNEDAFDEYLVFRSIIGENTMFKGVKNIRPGHYLKYNAGKLEQKRYFDLSLSLKPDYSKSFEEVCSEVEDTLQNSINIHLRSDVELGVLLSGGVDSSLITALASEKLQKKFHTFSISFPDSPECDESEYQQRISKRYGTHHHNYEMNESNFVKNIDRSIWHYEYPLNDPNSVCTYHLVEKAQKYITVMLCGEGADESFLGYNKFLNDTIRTIRQRTFLFNHPLLRKVFFALSGKPIFNITKYDPAMYALSYSDLNDIDKLLESCDDHISGRHEVSSRAGQDILKKIILQDQECDLMQWLLRADRIGMAKSMELRVPFCTPEMFSLANSIPHSYHIRKGERKCVLKKISEKYMDIDQIYRIKMGFGVPLERWMDNNSEYKNVLNSIFQSEKFLNRSFVNKIHILSLLNAYKQGNYQERNCGFIWTYFNLEKWYRIFFEGEWKSLAPTKEKSSYEIHQRKKFRYDYFSLKEVNPELWSKEFFWPVARKTTTQITTDLKDKLVQMANKLGNCFEADCLIISHLMPDTSIRAINHWLAITRIQKKGYFVECSDKLDLIPQLLKPEKEMSFSHENVWEQSSRNILEKCLKKFRYLLISDRYNFKRGYYQFWNHFRKKNRVVAFSNENVIYRPYTESLNEWISLTVAELWIDESKRVPLDDKLTIKLELLADEYLNFVISYAKDNFALDLPDNLIKGIRKYNIDYLKYIAGLYLSLKKKLRNNCPRHLLTPTAGAAFTRALSLAVRHEGGKVTGFPHGYFIGHHKGSRKALHEFATVDEFMAYTPGSSSLLKANAKLNSPPLKNPISFPYEQNPVLKDQWLYYSKQPLVKKNKTVMILELSLIPEWAGYYAAESMVNYHFYYNICKVLTEAGYKVLFKKRMKSLNWDGVNIFKFLKNFDVVFGSFDDRKVLDMADAYIIQYGMSSTLFNAMCTNKTVIYADAGWEDWFEEPYELMSKRCSILHCHYDERNRACFDKNELLGILEQKPTPPNTEFMEKYLFPEQ